MEEIIRFSTIRDETQPIDTYTKSTKLSADGKKVTITNVVDNEEQPPFDFKGGGSDEYVKKVEINESKTQAKFTQVNNDIESEIKFVGMRFHENDKDYGLSLSVDVDGDLIIEETEL